MRWDDELLEVDDEDEVVATALDREPAGADDGGFPAVLSPEGAEIDDVTEDDDAFEALREDLSPGEAARSLEDLRPLSEEENKILDDFPLEDLHRVDDAEHQQFMRKVAGSGHRGIDEVLDDVTYGDTMNHEEKMERIDSDDQLGWSIPGVSSLKKIASSAYKYGKKGVTAPLSATKWAGKRALGLVKKFVPSRDRGKAQMVKNLDRRLVVEHANWLGLRDQRAGRAVQPRAFYVAQSRPWARQQIVRAGLPVSTVVRGADVLGSEILGDDVVGSWWNPLSWFSEKVNVVVNQTSGARSPVGPDGQPIDPSQDPNAQDPYAQDPYAQDPSTQDPYAQEAYAQDPYAQEAYPQEAYPDAAYGDVQVGIAGRDDLGSFAEEILGGAAPEASDSPTKEDKMVKIAAMRLSRGQALAPGELAIVAALAKRGHAGAKKLYALLMREGAPVPGDDAGAWLHKLNPAYWLKSSAEKQFKDKEVELLKENAEIQKRLGKRGQVLAQAEKAKQAAAYVEAARAQAASTEAQLKAIEDSLKGLGPADSSGLESVLGHEKPTAVTTVVKKALDKIGKRKRAQEIYAKAAAGQPLDRADLKDAALIVRLLDRIRVVHGDFAGEPEVAMLHGAFVGACLRGAVRSARRRNAACGAVASHLSEKLASGSPTTAKDKKAAAFLIKNTGKLREVVHGFTSGRVLRSVSGSEQVRRACVVGAARGAMTAAEKKMLSAVVKLAKAGNPRAAESLRRLRQAGTVAGGDQMGISFNIKDAFKYATAPIWLPAKHIAKAAKWTGQKLGIVSKGGGGSPEQARLARMRAAAQRRKAAQARARAADAQTQAELRAQQSIADAADAEAEAADAEALSKEAEMRTKEIEADPDQAMVEDDEAGSFVGGWSEHVDGDERELVAKAAEESPAGTKIRAGAALYGRALAGDEEAREALATMIGRAKKGDQQARRDAVAVRAGAKALKAKKKAQKKEAKILKRSARRAKVRALQKRVEAVAANKLARTERKVSLYRHSVVEKKAARGNKRARAYVRKQVIAAKKGDKRALSRVEQMRIARRVRLAAPNKRERRNLAAAGRLYRKAKRGNPRAVRQLRVIQTSARAGNPNAKRAMKRVEVAMAVEAAVASGAVAAALAKGKRRKKSRAENQKMVARARARRAAGTASREELAAGVRAAQELGDKRAATELAAGAAAAPAATETIKKAASVVAAKDAGNEEARRAIDKSLEAARAGDPAGIKRAGNVVAANTMSDVKEGRPISPAMRDAVNLQERAAVGDPTAIDEVKRIAEAATSAAPPAEATAAAVTLAAAAVTAKAMASKPRAREEFLARTSTVPPGERASAEQELVRYRSMAEEGTITAEEGVRGVRLAEALGKPRDAAEIAAKAPPPPPPTSMSSMPDVPLAPITGVLSLLGETLRAVTLSTRDPLGNYREGIASRSSAAPAPASSTGWSPFSFFRSMIPGASLATSAAALVTSLTRRGEKKVAKVAPVPIPSAVPLPAEAVDKVTEKVVEATSSSGSDKTFKDYVSEALNTKKMSRRDFNRAVMVHAGEGASQTKKEGIGKTMLEFLAKRGVKVET